MVRIYLKMGNGKSARVKKWARGAIMEFFPEVEIQINGQKVSPGKVEIIKKIMPDLLEEDDGFWISKSSSIGITAPDGAIETILFGCTNYYC